MINQVKTMDQKIENRELGIQRELTKKKINPERLYQMLVYLPGNQQKEIIEKEEADLINHTSTTKRYRDKMKDLSEVKRLQILQAILTEKMMEADTEYINPENTLAQENLDEDKAYGIIIGQIHSTKSNLAQNSENFSRPTVTRYSEAYSNLSKEKRIAIANYLVNKQLNKLIN